jgi:HEAT repeat protein
MKRFFVAVAVVAALVLSSALAAAETVAEMAKKLLTHEDSRVRTQAALGLGSSGDAAATAPLCKGLGDSNDSVRAAAALGLGKLQKGGLDCLKKRLETEQVENVQKMLKKAIRLIEEGALGPVITDKTRYYMAIVKTKGGGKRQDADALVKGALRSALGSHAEVALAPEGETDADAKKRLRKHAQLVGYQLAPQLSLAYGGGRLTVDLDLEILGYPEKDSLGSVSRSLAVPLAEEDKDKENEIVSKLARECVHELLKLAAQVD